MRMVHVAYGRIDFPAARDPALFAAQRRRGSPHCPGRAAVSAENAVTLADRNRRMAEELQEGQWLMVRVLQALEDGREVPATLRDQARQWAGPRWTDQQSARAVRLEKAGIRPGATRGGDFSGEEWGSKG